jgi:hypothetical protein
MKSVRMGWVGHVAFRGKKKNACRVFMRKLEGDNLEVLYVEGKILQWTLKKQGRWHGLKS